MLSKVLVFGFPLNEVSGVAIVVVIALYLTWILFGRSSYPVKMRERFRQAGEAAAEGERRRLSGLERSYAPSVLDQLDAGEMEMRLEGPQLEPALGPDPDAVALDGVPLHFDLHLEIGSVERFIIPIGDPRHVLRLAGAQREAEAHDGQTAVGHGEAEAHDRVG
jgi:hypothetical protein